VKISWKDAVLKGFLKRNRRNKPETTPPSFMNAFTWEIVFRQCTFDHLLSFTTSVRCNSWPNPYTHGLYKPFRSLPVFKRECISCFCLNWFISLVYLSTAVLYPCSKCRYLVHVEDLSHILKEVYIVAIHTRIGL
jgi:hypothetical protein